MNKGTLPTDFIIAGAMKSGTSSLHNILNHHKNVFIPEGEIHFFDIDDFEQHPDFFGRPGNWKIHDFELELEKYVNWYRSFFDNAESKQLIGEDSTTYLASLKAPHRIKKFLPDVKIILLLRDPVNRTVSHYWHLVRSRRAIFNLENTLLRMPGTLIQRSCYKRQVERYFNIFPQKNIKVILFEEFINTPQKIIDETCEFLDIRPSINTDNIDIHKNKSKYPYMLSFRLLLNRILQKWNRYHYLPGETTKKSSTPKSQKSSTLIKYLSSIGVNYVDLSNKKPESVDEDTKEFLRQILTYENRGLSELINKDVSEWWVNVENI